MEYRELPESEAQSKKPWALPHKWMQDPGVDPSQRFSPGNKHYINGELVSEVKPRVVKASTTPFPRPQNSRRRIFGRSLHGPGDTGLLKDHGFDEAMVDVESPQMTNGVHSPRGLTTGANGFGSPTLSTTATTNGAGNHPISPTSEAGPAQARPLVNGVHGAANTADEIGQGGEVRHN